MKHKTVLDINQIEKAIRQFKANYPEFPYRFGLAGSYARGEQSESSDVDIVVDTDQLTIEQIELIKSVFEAKVDVLQLPLLKAEDEELDGFATEMGLFVNQDSVYKTVLREVVWFDQ